MQNRGGCNGGGRGGGVAVMNEVNVGSYNACVCSVWERKHSRENACFARQCRLFGLGSVYLFNVLWNVIESHILRATHALEKAHLPQTKFKKSQKSIYRPSNKILLRVCVHI